MSRFALAFVVLVIFAIFNTSLLVLGSLGVLSTTVPTTTSSTPNSVASELLYSYAKISTLLTPASWVTVVGLFVWRGRNRRLWSKNGLQEDVFELILNMKGGKNRVLLLKELSKPKDRLQLAKTLGLDWKTIDYHIDLLLKRGLIHEDFAYGNVKLFELTDIGRIVLNTLEEFNMPEAVEIAE